MVWLTPTLFAACAVATTLLALWRTVEVRRSVPADSTGTPGLRLGQRANFVGIAEIARFSAMRRRLGYQVSNDVVRTLADRLQEDGRCEVGRLGRTSIEFTYAAATSEEAAALMTVLRRSLEQPVLVAGIIVEPEIVIGSSPIRDDPLNDEMFDAAATAAEDARKLPSRIGFASDDAASPDRKLSVDLVDDLHEAIKTGALDLHYMPKLKLGSGRIPSAEALCRWTHPDHGVIPPGRFIPLAEETGLIADLTFWTLDRVIRDQASLAAAGLTLDLDINISGQLVSDADFCGHVIDRITRADARIGIEITETAVIEDPKAALVNITRFADAGLRIAIDDFGSGLSSLAYLRDLPANELKIDQSFIRALTTSNRDPLLVRSAIEIAHALEMEVTAEGVEDEVALALLKVMRCDNVQGYHISKPLPLDQLIQFLQNHAGTIASEPDSPFEGLRQAKQ